MTTTSHRPNIPPPAKLGSKSASRHLVVVTATVTSATVAIVLSVDTIALASASPYGLIGLGPALLAVAAIVRAVASTAECVVVEKISNRIVCVCGS